MNTFLIIVLLILAFTGVEKRTEEGAIVSIFSIIAVVVLYCCRFCFS